MSNPADPAKPPTPILDALQAMVSEARARGLSSLPGVTLDSDDFDRLDVEVHKNGSEPHGAAIRLGSETPELVVLTVNGPVKVHRSQA